MIWWCNKDHETKRTKSSAIQVLTAVAKGSDTAIRHILAWVRLHQEVIKLVKVEKCPQPVQTEYTKSCELQCFYIIKPHRQCIIQVIKRKGNRCKSKDRVATLEKRGKSYWFLFLSGRSVCVMWQGKTYIWRPHDKVEGKGEVKLKGKSSKDVFRVGKGTEQHQARLHNYK